MIIFTRHARNRMRRDKVNEADVEDCVGSPEFERAQGGGKVEAWNGYREGFLKVVYRPLEVNTLVITVTVKRKRPDWARS